MEKINGYEWVDHDDRNMTLIKFKIPKKLAAAAAAAVEAGDQERRVCLECDKEFSSGKALGGHMRIHLQSRNKNPNFLKPTKFKKTAHLGLNNGGGKPYYMNCVNDEGKSTCSQCGKTFFTMKSLFGHMRCHPERLWRGILPPPNTPAPVSRRRNASYSENSLSIDDGGGDEVVDLTKFLRRWPVTERRGRKSLKPANDNQDVVLLEAVEDLLSLANAGDSVTESGVTQQQLKVEVAENSPSVSLPDTEFVIEKGKAVMMDETDDEIMMKSSQKIKRRKKMKLMMDLEDNANDAAVTVPLAPVTEELAVTDECKYKCTTCNKGFATHQALGGHRSSHNKYRFISTDHIQEHEVHQCKVCDRVFATGQALGGHKRCHWMLSEAVQAPSSQVTSAREAGSQTGSGRKVLDFDLNEFPPAMMEEDDQFGSVDGDGYASSSYNSNMG